MIKPIKTKTVPNHDTVMFYFHPEDTGGLEMAEYAIRGSIVWPKGIIRGFALVAAQTLTTKILTVLEEFEFTTVRDKISVVNDGIVKTEGLNSFLEKVWKKYKCDTFYCSSKNKDLHKRFYVQIKRDPFLDVIPHLVKTRYSDDEKNVDPLIVDYIYTEKLKIEPDSIIYNQIRSYKKLNELVSDEQKNGLEALRCLFSGLEKSPWVPRSLPQEIPSPYC